MSFNTDDYCYDNAGYDAGFDAGFEAGVVDESIVDNGFF